MLITVRSVTAWDRRDWQLLPHCSSTMGAPSASPAPGVSKVQHKGHQPFSPYPVITQPEPATPSPSSTQPHTARGERDPFGHSHEQSYLGTVQGAPCSATTDLLIPAPPDVPAGHRLCFHCCCLMDKILYYQHCKLHKHSYT